MYQGTPSPAPAPNPDDIQTTDHETRDRIITGIVTVGPFIGLGIACWQAWSGLLNSHDLIVFGILYVTTTVGITVGFHRLFTHRSFKTTRWLRAVFAVLGSAAIEGPVVPGATPGAEARVVDFHSIFFDLPILEFRPYRAFDTKQSSAVLIQLYTGADVPKSAKVTWPPGAPGAKLETIYSIGLRLIFDWRRYF